MLALKLLAIMENVILVHLRCYCNSIGKNKAAYGGKSAVSSVELSQANVAAFPRDCG
jgi:hypothetical protein